jgi:apolipoprotein D and lipocalin family protein
MKANRLIWVGVAAIAAVPLLLYTRSTAPKGAKAVKPFDKDKYLGKWIEIARLDYYFEKDLTNVTAHYSLNDDGTIKVVNRGFDTGKGRWKESTGKAKFAGDPMEGKLKVSFFGPFYAGYNVLAVGDDYQHALVCGRNLNYMWILSRTTTIPENVKQSYLSQASALGYDVSRLTWVNHES